MPYRVALLYRMETGPQGSVAIEETRLARVAEALRAVGIAVEGAPYADDVADDVRAHLLRHDGVLVWVNPIEGGHDRKILSDLLQDVAGQGVLVSAHPEVIDKMGTKRVLHRTRSMSWGCDTRFYAKLAAFRAALPSVLAEGAPRVLKRERGNGGDGVWKVELAVSVAGGAASLPSDAAVRVRHAKRNSPNETVSLEAFIRRCEPYFSGGGGVIDQVYQPRLSEGMVRCYLVGDTLAGFGEQRINLLHPDAMEPGPRHYFPPTRPDFRLLKEKMETEWIAELCQILALDRTQLPVIWDADFLYGPKDAAGADTHVLCEINVSSVFPFPDDALEPLAAETLARLTPTR